MCIPIVVGMTVRCSAAAIADWNEVDGFILFHTPDPGMPHTFRGTLRFVHSSGMRCGELLIRRKDDVLQGQTVAETAGREENAPGFRQMIKAGAVETEPAHCLQPDP